MEQGPFGVVARYLQSAKYTIAGFPSVVCVFKTHIPVSSLCRAVSEYYSALILNCQLMLTGSVVTPSIRRMVAADSIEFS